MTDEAKPSTTTSTATVDTAPTEPSPAPVHTPVDEPWRLQTWVKGGTTSSRFDNMIAAAHADSEARRAEQDADRAAVRNEGAKMFSHQFTDAMDPRVVLEYDDSTWGKGHQLVELMEDDVTGDRLLTLVCLDCVARGIPSDLAQLRVSDRHRAWHLDTKTRGQPGKYVDAYGRTQVYVRAGEIMDTDVLKCSQYNCTFRVKITHNRIYRV